jgi:hypothetical protein
MTTGMKMTDPRCAHGALAFLRLPPRTKTLGPLHQCLASWSGIGLVALGMERQHFSLSSRKIEDKWIASFHHHPTLSTSGFGVASMPWRAVQRTAWAAMKRAA